jgi:hypothetical protein
MLSSIAKVATMSDARQQQRTLGSYLSWWQFFAICIVLVMVLVSFSPSRPPELPAAASHPAMAVSTPSISAAEVAECRRTIDARKADYVRLLGARQFREAREALGECPVVLNDEMLVALRDGADKVRHIATASDVKAPAEDRLLAIQLLAERWPEAAEPYALSLPKLRVQAERERAESIKRNIAAEKARRRKEGVTLGMTDDEVLDSQWGKPSHVNRTTNKHGVREQWVYPGGYLYFEDGKLTSIQN